MSFRTAFALLVGWFAGLALAQENTGLTRELVEQRIAALKAGGAADDSELVVSYGSVESLLSQAGSFDRDEQAFLDSLVSAPQRQAEIQARLDELEDIYDPTKEIDGLSPDELIPRLLLARAEERELSNELANLDRRLAAREAVATNVRTRLAEIETALDALSDDPVEINPAAAPSTNEAQQWRIRAQSIALAAEARAGEAQLVSQPVRFAAMALERGELAATSERLSALISELENRATTDEDAVVTDVELDIDETDPGFPLARSLADRVADLIQNRNNVSGQLNDARDLIADISQRRRALEDRYTTARRIGDFAGDSNVLGRVLLTYWEEIDGFEIADPT